jgi:hypothetical protein
MHARAQKIFARLDGDDNYALKPKWMRWRTTTAQWIKRKSSARRRIYSWFAKFGGCWAMLPDELRSSNG